MSAEERQEAELMEVSVYIHIYIYLFIYFAPILRVWLSTLLGWCLCCLHCALLTGLPV